MAQNSITERTTYTARRTSSGIELVIEAEGLHFVEETIPDGQMAGMKGHRPVPWTRTVSFDLHPQEARILADELRYALAELARDS